MLVQMKVASAGEANQPIDSVEKYAFGIECERGIFTKPLLLVSLDTKYETVQSPRPSRTHLCLPTDIDFREVKHGPMVSLNTYDTYVIATTDLPRFFAVHLIYCRAIVSPKFATLPQVESFLLLSSEFIQGQNTWMVIRTQVT